MGPAPAGAEVGRLRDGLRERGGGDERCDVLAYGRDGPANTAGCRNVRSIGYFESHHDGSFVESGSVVALPHRAPPVEPAQVGSLDKNIAWPRFRASHIRVCDG
jgi:hypothetical protein